jgi:hypothetical protein
VRAAVQVAAALIVHYWNIASIPARTSAAAVSVASGVSPAISLRVGNRASWPLMTSSSFSIA